MKDGSKKAPISSRRGRRAGVSGTREAILEAARSRFAEDGYAATTIRKIAAEAEVDGSLVMQFFGSKEELFAAVMSISPAALSRMADAFEGPAHGRGERVTQTFLEVWEGPSPDSDALLAMLRAVVSSEVRSAEMREYFQARLVEAISPKLEHKDAVPRAGLVASMLIGVIIGRRVVQIPALADRDTLVQLLAPAVQLILR